MSLNFVFFSKIFKAIFIKSKMSFNIHKQFNYKWMRQSFHSISYLMNGEIEQMSQFLKTFCPVKFFTGTVGFYIFPGQRS